MAGPTQPRLFASPLSVINIGLSGFAGELASAGVPVTHVDWTPPAGGDAELAVLIERISGDAAIEVANREAVQRILSGEPVLIDVMPAVAAIPDPGRRPDHPARRAADRMGAHVRPDARRGLRRHRVRGLGDRSCSGARRWRPAAASPSIPTITSTRSAR